MRNGWYDCMEW